MNSESVKKHLKVYWLYFRQFWKSRLVYKSDFLLGIFAQSINLTASLAFLTLLYTQVKTINGWSYPEILFLTGIGGVIMTLHHIFLMNIYRLGDNYIISGDLDRFLVRPLNPLFQVYADEVRDNNISKTVINIALIIYATGKIELKVLTFEKLLYGAGALFSGIMVLAATFLVFASTAFWTGRSRAAVWLIFRVLDFRRYPYGIYGRAVQVLLVTALPIAFASFFPANFLLEKPGWQFWELLSLVAGPFLYFFAYQFWKSGLENYSSTGS